MPRPWVLRPQPPGPGLIRETRFVLIPSFSRRARCGTAGLVSAVTQGRDLRWRQALQGSGGCLPAGISHQDAAMGPMIRQNCDACALRTPRAKLCMMMRILFQSLGAGSEVGDEALLVLVTR